MDELTLPLIAERIKCLEEKMMVQRDSDRLAMDRAAAVLGERLETMNQFRSQIQEERGTYIRRDFYDIAHIAQGKRIEIMEKIISNFEGRFWMFGIGVTIMSALISILLQFMGKK